MRKKITLAIIISLCCLLLTSCGTYLPDYVSFWREISPKGTIKTDGDVDIIYNDRKYINIMNANGKIRIDYNSENCVKIATMQYSYLLGAVFEFYGDDFEKPSIISSSREKMFGLEKVWKLIIL